MKKVLLLLLALMTLEVTNAQSVFIYLNNGSCEIIDGSKMDCITTNGTNDILTLHLQSGDSSIIQRNILDSIVVSSRQVSVTTLSATNISKGGATLNGSVDWVEPLQVGFLISTEANPDMSNSTSYTANYSSRFSVAVSNLSMNTTYYYRAFAYRGDEYIFGAIMSFTTPAYSVGDFYPDDNHPIGVVFYTYANGTHGKMVSLIHSRKKWDTSGLFCTDTYAYNENDGSNNRFPSNSPLKQWIISNFDATWYCPAKGELLTLCNNITLVNSALRSHGYEAHEDFFWSSTQYDANNAYIVCVTNYMGYSNGWSGYNSKDVTRGVLAIKKF